MRLLWLLLAALIAGVGSAWAESLRFDSEAGWRSWQMPRDLVQIGAEGGLRLKKFRKEINAVANAGNFSHPTQERGEVAGGIWEAKSSPQMANFAIDGDHVLSEWTIAGEIRATGKLVRWRGMGVCRLESGRQYSAVVGDERSGRGHCSPCRDEQRARHS